MSTTNIRKVVGRNATEKVCKDFIKRGRTLSKRISNSAPTRSAAGKAAKAS